MRSIAIVTDSNCGMSPAQARELGVHMLPMPFFIDDKEYLEDIDMNQADFFPVPGAESGMPCFHLTADSGICHRSLG